MATVNLGAIKFNWKGAYNNSTAYVADDVVSSGGNSYVCILASTGNAVSNTTYWSLMAQAGTNGTDGTDVGTTITTQGDILYRDGSGLQRLGAGTSGQVLTTGGSGANVSWTTPSGGAWTMISTAEASSSSEVTFTGINTTYDHYAIAISDARISDDDKRFEMHVGSGSLDTNNNCSYFKAENSTFQNGTASLPYMYIASEVGTNTGEGVNLLVWIHTPTDANTFDTFSWHGGYRNKDNVYKCLYGGGEYVGASAIDRVAFKTSYGSIASGRFTLYGLKHT